MTGPGELQGSAAAAQYDPDSYALYQQEESQLFQAEQAERYAAYCTRTSWGEYTANTAQRGYEEPAYQFPNGEHRDA